MSVDWEKYSTAEMTRARAINPAKNGVVSLEAGMVRAVEGLTVGHRPSKKANNRAHSEVFGDKKSDPQVRVTLRRIARWEIPYECPCESSSEGD
jgi:hypothetical protein